MTRCFTVWVYLQVDRDAPTSWFARSLPAYIASRHVELYTTGWDLTSTVRTFVRCDDASGCNWVAALDASTAVAFDDLTDGVHMFEVMAVDAAGNNQAPPFDTVNVTVDTVPPGISILPLSKYTNNATTAACVSVADSSPTTVVVNVTYRDVTTTAAPVASTASERCAVVEASSEGRICNVSPLSLCIWRNSDNDELCDWELMVTSHQQSPRLGRDSCVQGTSPLLPSLWTQRATPRLCRQRGSSMM